MVVVLLKFMQYSDFPRVFRGFGNLNSHKLIYFCKHCSTPPPCGYGTEYRWNGSLLELERWKFVDQSSRTMSTMGYILVSRLTRLNTLVYNVDTAEYL